MRFDHPTLSIFVLNIIQLTPFPFSGFSLKRKRKRLWNSLQVIHPPSIPFLVTLLFSPIRIWRELFAKGNCISQSVNHRCAVRVLYLFFCWNCCHRRIVGLLVVFHFEEVFIFSFYVAKKEHPHIVVKKYQQYTNSNHMQHICKNVWNLITNFRSNKELTATHNRICSKNRNIKEYFISQKPRICEMNGEIWL